MFAASARHVNSNPTTVAAIERVARRRQQRLIASDSHLAQQRAIAERQAERAVRLLHHNMALRKAVRKQRRLASLSRFVPDKYAAEFAEEDRPYTLHRIALMVCTAYGVSLADLKSARRGRDIVLPRQCFCYWAKKLTGKSLPTIGRFIGGRDHTTVMHAIKVFPEKKRAAQQARRAA